jgi:hypothetical protein
MARIAGAARAAIARARAAAVPVVILGSHPARGSRRRAVDDGVRKVRRNNSRDRDETSEGGDFGFTPNIQTPQAARAWPHKPARRPITSAAGTSASEEGRELFCLHGPDGALR